MFPPTLPRVANGMPRLRKALFVPVGLLLLYLGAANVLLNSGTLPRLISARPEAILVRWSSAWTPWPGRVYIEGFYLRAQDPGAQWELTVDHATTQVALLALATKTFETRWVRARGVEFRYRLKVPRDTEPEVTAPYPPVQGFPVPHLTEEPWRDDPPPWRVRLEHVTVQDAREVWLGPYRGRLQKKELSGLFLLNVRGFQIGLKKSGGKTQTEIFNARRWFEKENLTASR